MKRENNPFRPRPKTPLQRELGKIYAPEPEQALPQSAILTEQLGSVAQTCASLANSARIEVDNGNHSQMIDSLHRTLMNLNSSKGVLNEQAVASLQRASTHFESWSRSISRSSNGRQRIIKNINREFRQLIAFLGKKYK